MRATRAVLLLTGSLAAGALVAGCGGSGGDEESGPVVASSASTDTATDPASGGSAGDSYLPVPAGVQLTAPGTHLDLRKKAVVAWNPQQGQVGAVSLKVTAIKQTTIQQSFDGYRLDSQTKKDEPYFVKYRAENVGDSDVGGRQLPVYAVDDQQQLVEATTFADDFAPCPDASLPLVFATDDKASGCLVFLLPKGASLQAVQFQPPAGIAPIRWVGEAQPLKSDTKKKDKKGRGDKKGDGRSR